jgi:peroxiredoxin
LAAVQEKIKFFDRLGIKVIAASTDAESGAKKVITEQEITYLVGFGMSQAEIDTLGAFAGERQGETIVQPVEFLLRPWCKIAASLYTTSQLGRMSPRKIAGFVKDRS